LTESNPPRFWMLDRQGPTRIPQPLKRRIHELELAWSWNKMELWKLLKAAHC
jgi:hypothetical protein